MYYQDRFIAAIAVLALAMFAHPNRAYAEPARLPMAGALLAPSEHPRFLRQSKKERSALGNSWGTLGALADFAIDLTKPPIAPPEYLKKVEDGWWQRVAAGDSADVICADSADDFMRDKFDFADVGDQCPGVIRNIQREIKENSERQALIEQTRVQVEAQRKADEERAQQAAAAEAEAESNEFPRTMNIAREKYVEGVYATVHASCRTAAREARVPLPRYEPLIERCTEELSPILADELRSGVVPLVNCYQWALINESWRDVGIRMTANALGAATSAPAQFTGKVMDSDGRGTLLVFYGQGGDHAYVKVTKKTKVIDQDRIRMDVGVHGYGTHAGTERVQLANGGHATVPVIEALCIR